MDVMYGVTFINKYEKKTILKKNRKNIYKVSIAAKFSREGKPGEVSKH